MKDILWYSMNKDLSIHKENPLTSFDQAEKIIDSYIEKFKNISKYTATEEYQKGDGTDILTQTLFGFNSEDDKSKLEINMGEKYQIEFQTKKSEAPLLFWMKYKKKYETSNLSELKSVVNKFFELDRESFKRYFNF